MRSTLRLPGNPFLCARDSSAGRHYEHTFHICATVDAEHSIRRHYPYTLHPTSPHSVLHPHHPNAISHPHTMHLAFSLHQQIHSFNLLLTGQSLPPGRPSRAVHYLFIPLYRSGPEPIPPHGTTHRLACISFIIPMYRYLSSRRATYSVVDNHHALSPAICNLPTHRFRSLFAVGPLPTLMYTTAFVSLSPHIHRMALLKFVPLLCMMSARRVRCLRDVRKELSART